MSRNAWLQGITIVAMLTLAGVASFGTTDATRRARRAQIEQLSPSDKQRLLELSERFAVLEPAEQQRLRRLHAQLEAAPDAEALRQTMDRYQQWLSTLSALQRAELSQLPSAARVERISQWMRERRAFESMPFHQYQLSQADREALAEWVEKTVLASIPEERRPDIEHLPEADRRRILGRMLVQRLQQTDLSKARTPPPEFNELQKRLSSGALRQMEQAQTSGQRLLLFASWLAQSTGLGGSEQQLREFFERDMPASERQRLLAMSSEQMQRELRAMYFRHLSQQAITRPDGRPLFPKGGRPEDMPKGELRDRMREEFSPRGPTPSRRNDSSPPFPPKPIGKPRPENERL